MTTSMTVDPAVAARAPVSRERNCPRYEEPAAAYDARRRRVPDSVRYEKGNLVRHASLDGFFG